MCIFHGSGFEYGLQLRLVIPAHWARARDESPRALIAGRLDGSTKSATAQTKGNFKTFILASPLILLLVPLLGRFLFTVSILYIVYVPINFKALQAGVRVLLLDV